MKDYRWRLTNKVKRVLRNNFPVVVIAGPQMGKTHLVKLIEASQIPVQILEDVEPENIGSLIEKPSPTLITTDIRFLEDSVAYKDLCFRVPLTTIMRKHIHRWNQVNWDMINGHPALAACQNDFLMAQRRAVLEKRWEQSLKAEPLAEELLLNLRAHRTNPVEHYQRLRKVYGKTLKPTLDWLVCLGAIHRQKYKDGAGISPLPINGGHRFIQRPYHAPSFTPGSHAATALPSQFNI